MMRMRLARRFWICGLAIWLLACRPGVAQIPGLPSAASPPARPADQDSLGRDTPHGCLVGFLRAAERGDYSRAAAYLDAKASSQAVELARQLHAILNAGAVAALDTVPRTPEGDLKDGLPDARERVGTIDTDEGKLDILLERVQRGGRPAIWLFSADTLRAVPRAAAGMEGGGIERYLPSWFREIRILSLPLYRWVGTIFGIALAMFLAWVGSRVLLPLIRPVVRRITREPDDRRLAALSAPIWLILLALGFRSFGSISITVLGRQFWIELAAAMAVVGFTWLSIRVSDVVAERAVRRFTQRESAGKLAVLSLMHRLFKIAAVIAGAVVIVYIVGGDVTAILAGVGLGGIVIALAAQKTMENLFGGVALISDEPIRVGDFCRFGDKLGSVQDIGLRSTRVRTLARTVLSIPNGQLSTMPLENFTLRDKFLFNHKIGLRYETTPVQMQRVLLGIRDLLRAHPGVDREDARVRLVEFGDSAFIVEVFAYLVADSNNRFLEAQEDLLVRILDIIVAAGSGVAFPSRTVYLAQDTPCGPETICGAGTLDARPAQPAARVTSTR